MDGVEPEKRGTQSKPIPNRRVRWGRFFSLSSACVCALLGFSFRRAQMRAGAMNLDNEGGEVGEQGLKKASYLAACRANFVAVENPGVR